VDLHIRRTTIERGVSGYAEGSALIRAGRTKVLVTASVLQEVPKFLMGSGSGWITAEYGMLPRSTRDRKPRPEMRNRPDGRALEIQRLIGRALRQTTELGYLNGRTVHVDCDVLEADGGTRVASINGGVVALVDALVWMKRKKLIPGVPLKGLLCAASVALVKGEMVLDPDYPADSSAEVDLNAVFSQSGDVVEVQATAERAPASEGRVNEMIALAKRGAFEALDVIRAALGSELMAEAGITPGA
jgi:ribonuclease PH